MIIVSSRSELGSPNISEKIWVLQPPPSSAHRVPPRKGSERRTRPDADPSVVDRPILIVLLMMIILKVISSMLIIRVVMMIMIVMIMILIIISSTLVITVVMIIIIIIIVAGRMQAGLRQTRPARSGRRSPTDMLRAAQV